MPFRVPVLETFLWQKEVIKIIDTLPKDDIHKGDRYIVSKDTNDTELVRYRNCIAWADGGGEWGFDAPKPGWVTVITNPNAFEETETTWQLVRFDGNEWNLYTVDQLHVDSKNFNIQIPKIDPDHKNENDEPLPWTLQHLLEWMDRNMGGPGPLGIPPDKTYGDGLFDWTDKTKVNEAIDDANEALKDLAPAKPDALTGMALNINAKTYPAYLSAQPGAYPTNSRPAFTQPDPDTGRSSQLASTNANSVKFKQSVTATGGADKLGTGGTEISTGIAPGGSITPGQKYNNFIIQDSISLFTDNPVPVDAGGISYGDKGLLKSLHLAGTDNTTLKPETNADFIFDMGKNYYEADPGFPRYVKQNLELWFQRGESSHDIITSPAVTQDLIDSIPTTEDGELGEAYKAKRDGADPNHYAMIQAFAPLKNNPEQNSSKYNYLRINEVKKFNKFNLWQKVSAMAHYEELADGYHCFYMIHKYSSTPDISNPTEVFVETDKTAIEGSGSFNVETPVIKTISGISYYTVGTELRVNYTTENQITAVYGNGTSDDLFNVASTPGSVFTAQSYKPGNQNTAQTPPVKGQSVTYSPKIKCTSGTVTSENLKLAVTAYYPIKENKANKTDTLSHTKDSVTKSVLYNGYMPEKDTSTIVKETFKYETYRLPASHDFDSTTVNFPTESSKTSPNNWDSGADLSSTDDAVIYMNSLRKNTPAAVDLPTRLPENNKNYARSGGVVYYRWFGGEKCSGAQSSIILTITGTNLQNKLQPVQKDSNGNYIGTGYNIEFKLPNGLTGWIDGGAKAQSSLTEQTIKIDGTPCQDGAYDSKQGAVNTATQFKQNFTFSTVDVTKAKKMVYVRIRIFDENITISEISTNW